MSLAGYLFFFPIAVVQQRCLRVREAWDAYLLGFCHSLPLGSMSLKDKEEPTDVICFRPEIMHLACSTGGPAPMAQMNGMVLGSQGPSLRITMISNQETS